MLPHGAVPPLRGLAAIYSNNLLKPMPAGAGGMLVTDDDEFADRVRAARDELPGPALAARARLGLEELLHDHWLTAERYWRAYDLHRRMSGGGPTSRAALIDREIVAAEVRLSARQRIRGEQALEQVEIFAAERTAAVATYRSSLAGTSVELPIRSVAEPLYYFPVLIRDKAGLLDSAREHRVEIVAWPISRPIYPVETDADLRLLDYPIGGAPVAESVAARLVGLPTRLGPDHPQVGLAVDLVRVARREVA
jgi:dTDP-4-amino-4,6-dideoxygalactose transaminase